MRRREFIGLVGGAASWPLVARAQQGERIRRVGLLTGLAQDDPEAQARIKAFQQRLQKLGWTEGRNVHIDYRWTAGDVGRARTYAAELVALAPNVILVNTPPGLAALQKATRTIPIVFVQVVDASESSATSIAHPGGNVTGFYSYFDYTIIGKWLEVLKEIAPQVRRVAIMQNVDHPAWPGYLRAINDIAPSFGVDVVPAGLHGPTDVKLGIDKLAREPDGGLIVLPDSMTGAHRNSIIDLAAIHRIPAVYPLRFFVASGGLVSYGADLVASVRQATSYVDRILRGANPADLPAQQSTKLELVVNLKTAKALGFTIPETLLATADEVIQ
jgi:putative ABC transport system substrate-binding protein